VTVAERLRALEETWHSKAWTGEISTELAAIRAEVERVAYLMRGQTGFVKPSELADALAKEKEAV